MRFGAVDPYAVSARRAARLVAVVPQELQPAFESADPDQRDDLRRVMIAIFTELGPDSELAREHRRRLSAVLY